MLLAMKVPCGQKGIIENENDHINEEVFSYRAASKLRGKEKSLPEDIRRAFDVAKQYMAGIHEDIWVDTLCK